MRERRLEALLLRRLTSLPSTRLLAGVTILPCYCPGARGLLGLQSGASRSIKEINVRQWVRFVMDTFTLAVNLFLMERVLDTETVIATDAHLATLKEIFRPASPTDDRELFQGRQRELDSCIAGFQEVGQHIVVYGERGVGKTSLAYIAKAVFQAVAREGSLAIRLQCAEGDTFDSVWRKFHARLVSELDLLDSQVGIALKDTVDRIEGIINYADSDVSVDDVARALKLLSSRVRLLIIIDEFDRVGGWTQSVPFADLIKTLSDDLVRATLLIVGVADDVEGLLNGHQSVERNLRQVAMPRMSRVELEAIVERGYETFRKRAQASLACEKKAARAIANLSQGFPYYAHLLAGAAGAKAIRTASTRVTPQTVIEAMLDAVEDASHAIKVKYTEAVTARSDAQFHLTLLACALSEMDDLGYFSAADVSKPLASLVGQERKTSVFHHHLKRFSEDPIYILDSRVSRGRNRYRFHDPLMKPFVLMKGFTSGKLNARSLHEETAVPNSQK